MENNSLNITQLCNLIKDNIPNQKYIINGEVNQLKYSHGHIFFTFTDNTNYISATIWKNKLDLIKNKIKEGDNLGMWIDLEGTAYEAITASTKIINNISFLKVEVEDKQYWENQKLSAEVINLLSQHNMVPLIRDFEGTSVLQYNILFCNSRLINPTLDIFLKELLKNL